MAVIYHDEDQRPKVWWGQFTLQHFSIITKRTPLSDKNREMMLTGRNQNLNLMSIENLIK
jgi:hypothetical protein